MKTFIIFLFLLSFYKLSFAQNTLTPSLSVVYLEQPQMFGFRFSNEFNFQIKKQSFKAGFDFILARGNKNVKLHHYNNYNFEYLGHNPDFPGILGGSTLTFSFPVNINSKTSSSTQYNLNLGYKLPFGIMEKINIDFSVGFYASYVITNYLIGTFEAKEIDFGKTGYYTSIYDVALPVYLRYFNVGAYINIDYSFQKIIGVPLGIKFSYYYGRFHSGLWSLGVSVPLKFAAVDSEIVKE